MNMAENKKGQVLFIHGGDSFDSKADYYEFLRSREVDPYEEKPGKWRDSLAEKLEGEGFEYLFVAMPDRWNADYTAWSIWFEKYLPYLDESPNVFVGHSLGASFLLKYLAENKLDTNVRQLHLVSPAIGFVPTHGLEKFASAGMDLSLVAEQASEIHIYHSKDDEVVDYKDSEELAKVLPSAVLHTFTDRGHFLTPEFREIEEEILRLK
tara:strand:+ start:753 stop:1379 length:627 start_codon:yes stop_codon:yes gene_type:complete